MEFNKFASNVEKSFNIAAGIPFVAIPSSLLRASVATVHATTSFTIGCLGLIAQLIDSDPKWKQMTKHAIEHFVHAKLNGLRASGELQLAVTVFGSPLLFLTQLLSNQFAPLFPYSKKTPEIKENGFPQIAVFQGTPEEVARKLGEFAGRLDPMQTKTPSENRGVELHEDIDHNCQSPHAVVRVFHGVEGGLEDWDGGGKVDFERSPFKEPQSGSTAQQKIASQSHA